MKIGDKVSRNGRIATVKTNVFLNYDGENRIVIDLGTPPGWYVTDPSSLKPLPVFEYAPLYSVPSKFAEGNIGKWKHTKTSPAKPTYGWLVRTDGVVTGWEPAE